MTEGGGSWVGLWETGMGIMGGFIGDQEGGDHGWVYR